VAAGEYDVVIIGAGAAGCAAALRLPPGSRALLVDRAAPPHGRCCGGLLAPDGQAALAALGLELPETVRVGPQPQTVHVLDLDTRREQTYRRNYINLDRAAFDSWLVGLAAQRVELRPDTRLVDAEAEDASGAWQLRLSTAGREEVVRAGLVIGADGADSFVRLRCLGTNRRPDAMMAIQIRQETPMPPENHEVFFSRLVPDFYAWAIPKPRSVVVGAAFSDVPGARQSFDRLLPQILQELSPGNKILERSARRLTRPRSRLQLLAGGGRVLLAGEAAGLVSPSSGEGLSFALESGAAAGAAAGAADPLTAYRPAFRSQADRVARKLLKAQVIFSPFWRPLAMRLPWCP
jgi:geranylgeranyl diphosphate/geranylgeranyl-bacteriochlorophyllide a reductase